jgi:hypothetical protein
LTDGTATVDISRVPHGDSLELSLSTRRGGRLVIVKVN